ncbi:helicase type I site-specific restriction-modification system restriction subunit [Clostridium sp. CAG:715]|nr:helicase type I site-specific restriction-modification system restriction subunit [Clostridium sp. CAG:715]
MPTNFDFLKKVDKNLFEIVAEAEKLYRDEYFEQSMVQTRRFGEHVCKKVLGKNRTTEETFDEMLATLNDCSFGNVEEKEFINDLYFLKKHGNSAVHSGSVKKDGMEALECLKRAFEVAISYCIYNRKANPKIMRLSYDTELLVTGEKNKKLSDRYKEAKEKAVKSSDFDEPKLKKSSATKSKSTKTTKKKTTKKQSSVMVCKSKKSFPIFWILVGITFVISLLIFLVLFVSIH